MNTIFSNLFENIIQVTKEFNKFFLYVVKNENFCIKNMKNLSILIDCELYFELLYFKNCISNCISNCILEISRKISLYFSLLFIYFFV